MTEPLATVRHETDGGTGVVILAGEVDLSNAEEVFERICDAPAPGPAIVLDLTEVAYLDSIGIAMIARVRERYPELAAVAPRESHIGKLLAMVSLGIPLYDTRSEAVGGSSGTASGG